MPEWEERKALLAQRRVESVRLLAVLLNQIKNVVLSSRQVAEPPADTGNEREGSFLPRPAQKALKQKRNSCRLVDHDPKDEKKPECPSVDLDGAHAWTEEEQQQVTREEPAPPCPLVRTVVNKAVARVITSRLAEEGTSSRRAGGSLQVTVTQHGAAEEPPNRGARPPPNCGNPPEAARTGKGRKRKAYETEEFIHYLLNYYRTPRYARVCPPVQSPAETPRWQRAVSCRGDGFRVTLENKEGGFLTELALVPNRPGRDTRETYSDNREVIDKEPVTVQVMPNSRACAGELAQSYRDVAASNETLRLEGHACVMGCPGVTCHVSSREGNPGVTAGSPRKPFGRAYKLKDLLEEISSDSECFGEALHETLGRTERRNGGCRSGCGGWPLGPRQTRALLICVQNVACGNQTQRSFCSGPEHRGAIEDPGRQLQVASKRPSRDVRPEGQGAKWPPSEDEREAGRRRRRKKKRSSSHSFPDDDDEPSFPRANHYGELESPGKAQRKCAKMFHHYHHHHQMKCKTPPAVKAQDGLYLSAPRPQEGHPGAGKRTAERSMAAARGGDLEGRHRACKRRVER